MGWREKLEIARDTVDDVVFRVTDRALRCPKRKGWDQCERDRGHRGKHQHGDRVW